MTERDMHSRGGLVCWVCVRDRGHAWQVGMRGRVGGVCVAGDFMHGRGECMAGAVCLAGGHAWQILQDTVNERAVRILLECILVVLQLKFYFLVLILTYQFF